MIDTRPIAERPRLCSMNRESHARQLDGIYAPIPNENCKLVDDCWCCVCVAAPLECVPCSLCKSRLEVYCEIPVNGDHDGRGFVMRVGCLCKASVEHFGEGNRTEFETYVDAIHQWNEMQEDECTTK